MSTYRYMDISSNFRNRNLYPYTSDFVVPVSFTNNNISNPFLAADPISLAVPTVNSLTQAGSTTNNIVLNANSSTINNYYINQYIGVSNQYSTITSYNPSTFTATINPPYSSAPLVNTQYLISGALPSLTGTVNNGSNQQVVNLGNNASSDNGAYVGYFIYFSTGTNNGVSQLISAYTGSTQSAKMAKALPNIPNVGDPFLIAQYSGDNASPLLYSGTIGMNQAVCYSIELLYLTLPNQILSSGYGGSLDKYPYVYLYIYNEGNQHTEYPMYSNNRINQSATFKIPLGITLKSETFFTLKDARMIEVIKFKIDQPIRFRLVLPDGSPIIFVTPDNSSPMTVNPLVQISASFALRRIDGENTKK